MAGFGEAFMNNPWTVGTGAAVLVFLLLLAAIKWKEDFYD